MDNKDLNNYNLDDDFDLLGANPDGKGAPEKEHYVRSDGEPDYFGLYADLEKSAQQKFSDSDENKEIFDGAVLDEDQQLDDGNIDIRSSSSDNLDIRSSESEIFDLNNFDNDDKSEEPVKEPQKKKFKVLTKNNILMSVLAVFLVMALTASIVAASALNFVFNYEYDDIKNKVNLEEFEQSYTTVIYVQNKNGEWVEYRRLHGTENRIWTEYNLKKATNKNPEYTGIPQNLANAFVAIEDKRFFEHDGVDWKRTISAFANMIIPFSNSAYGGSTITQQLVKNLTRDDDRTASRKLREIIQARQLEEVNTKERILEVYMNTIAMGRGMCGVAVPAKYYFGKNVNELTLAECASLAAITKNPEYYRPDKHPENNLKRRNFVLYEMFDQELISEKEYNDAVAEKLNVVADSENLKGNIEINSYFVDALIEEVVATLVNIKGYDREEAIDDFYNGGYKIYATVDPEVQAAMEKVYTDEKYIIKGKDDKIIQGSMTVLDYNGNIKGIVGGIGEKTENRGLNRATMSPRQPGSTMKPLAAYTPAIEGDLITYSTILEDKKYVYYEGKEYEWSPPNWYDGYRGMMTIEYALRNSVNTIPTYIVDLLKPEKAFDFVYNKLGLKSLENPGDANYSPLGMGGTRGGVTTLQSAAAFAPFGDRGFYSEPTTFTAIYDQFGELVVSRKPQKTVVMGEDTACIMNHLLQTVVKSSDGTGKMLNDYFTGMPVYAKTGTSNSGEYARDVWFVGGTPYYVASAWCGYDSNQELKKEHEKMALKMWGEVMAKIHEGLPVKDFEESKYTQCRIYCSETGGLATTGCPIGGYGWYKGSGQKVCSKHAGKVIVTTSENDVLAYLYPDPEPETPEPEEPSEDPDGSSDTDSSDSNT